MEKKILVAVDNSLAAKNAVHYAADLYKNVNDLRLMLFHVQPRISDFLVEEANTDPKARAALKRLKQKNAEEARNLLETYKSDMVDKGVGKGHVEIMTQKRNIGLAKDIIDFSHEKRFDAVLVGRQGYSRVKDVFMGSLTAKLAEHSQVIPVWILDGNIASNKVMVAVDGSESALRAVDHLSFMMENRKDVAVTLFHVTPKMRDYCEINMTDDDEEINYLISSGDRRCIDNFMQHATNKFKLAGISAEQIEIKQEVRMFGVGKAIVDEAAEGGYGTVVVGRRGVNRAFFMGSVSNYVMNKITDCALWLVP